MIKGICIFSQLEDDTLNLTRFKLMGGRLLLKKGAIPRRFECQGKNIERARAAATRRDLQRQLNEVLQPRQEVNLGNQNFISQVGDTCLWQFLSS